jgi:hypothetical protein
MTVLLIVNVYVNIKFIIINDLSLCADIVDYSYINEILP